MDIAITTGIGIAALSFAAEYVDSSLGTGYGATLTPVLLLLGFAPLEVTIGLGLTTILVTVL